MLSTFLVGRHAAEILRGCRNALTQEVSVEKTSGRG